MRADAHVIEVAVAIVDSPEVIAVARAAGVSDELLIGHEPERSKPDEHREEGTGDRTAPLVHEISEEAQDPDEQDEMEGATFGGVHHPQKKLSPGAKPGLSMSMLLAAGQQAHTSSKSQSQGICPGPCFGPFPPPPTSCE